MGSYSGEGSVDKNLNIIMSANHNIGLLASFEEENEEENLNATLVFDNNLNINKFLIKELELDIKHLISEKQAEYFKNLYLSGRREICEDFMIDYEVSGHYDPGRMSGPPEYCYPPESDEERNITNCSIKIKDLDEIFLPNSCFDKIYDLFGNDIDRQDFSSNDDDGYYDEPDDYDRNSYDYYYDEPDDYDRNSYDYY